MATILAGVIGGFVATVVMSIVMMAMGGGPPPTANLLAKFQGGQPDDYQMPGMVLHLGYGTVAGGVLVFLVESANLGVTTLTEWLVVGLVYAVVLLVGGAVVWIKGVIGLEPDREMLIGFTVVHLVYGLVLGGWVGLGILA